MTDINELDRIKVGLQNNIGRKIRLTSRKGRKRTVVVQGIIESTHPSVFIIKLDKNKSVEEMRVSYSYIDVLTKTVEIALYKQASKLEA